MKTLDALNHAADRILIAVIFHSAKSLSALPKVRARLSDIATERDAIVREHNKKYGQKKNTKRTV